MADAKAIIRDIEAAFHHYIDVFNREDAVGFVGCYAHPHSMLSGELGMVVSHTEADHHLGYQRIMEGLHKRNWGRTGIDRLQVFLFSASLAQVVADVTRYKTEGAILEELRVSYMFRRDGGAWKILSFGRIEAPFSGPGVEP